MQLAVKIEQADIVGHERLFHAAVAKHGLVGGVRLKVVEFGIGDIVRSGMCAIWVRAFAEARI